MEKIIKELERIDQIYAETKGDINFMTEEEMDICIACNDAFIWAACIGTDADIFTGGEATRRYEMAKEELRKLGKTI